MIHFKKVIRIATLYSLALILAGSYVHPVANVMAETAPVTDTKAAAPVTPKYTYNPATGGWESDEWSYDGTSGTYKPGRPVEKVVTVETPPSPEQTPAPVSPAVVEPVDVKSLSNQQQAQTDANTSTTITTTVQADAVTGNADVTKNTSAGDATTGDASVDATIVNVVHSSIQGNTAGVAHFTSDIYGNVVGDITLSPAIDSALANNVSPITTGSSQVAVTTGIKNDLSLSAQSGNATVAQNTSAGNATTGSANTVANVLNLVNSIIAANQSFIGTINIYGDLNGDILVSPNFIPQLVADNSSKVVAPDLLSLSTTDSQSIINNINLNAQTGAADVTKNTTAGNATTGQAQTNLTVLNLTGHQVTASNSLLIFVNVLGKWVGVIVDAPVGATAAMLGSGVTSSLVAPLSQNTSVDNSSGIVNNLDLTSRSGDASVDRNTLAGNATSGNATASANVLNMDTSSISLSGWFGILFINVFGSWEGSFGINTKSGEVVPNTMPSSFQSAAPGAQPFQFGFMPKVTQQGTHKQFVPITSGASSNTSQPASQAVLAAATHTRSAATPQSDIGTSSNSNMSPIVGMIMSLGFMAVTTVLGIKLYRR